MPVVANVPLRKEVLYSGQVYLTAARADRTSVCGVRGEGGWTSGPRGEGPPDEAVLQRGRPDGRPLRPWTSCIL